MTCTIHSLLGFVFAALVATRLIAGVLSMLLLGLTLPAMLGASSPPGTEGASAVQPLPMLLGCPTHLGLAQASPQSPHLRRSPDSVHGVAQPLTPAYSQ